MEYRCKEYVFKGGLVYYKIMCKRPLFGTWGPTVWQYYWKDSGLHTCGWTALGEKYGTAFQELYQAKEEIIAIEQREKQDQTRKDNKKLIKTNVIVIK